MARIDVNAVLDHIRGRGGRVTPVTRLVVEMVVKYPDSHFRSIDFVRHANSLEPTTESTVYRTLDRLVTYGVLERSRLGAGPTQFFHLGRHHHEHLVCDQCSRIIDIPTELLDDVAKRVQEKFGFQLKVGLSNLHGTCADCNRTVDEDAAVSRPSAHSQA